MKGFLKKTISFLLVACSFLLLLIFGFPEMRRGLPFLQPGFAEKLNESDVIIVGDSRAARQVDPAVIYETTGLSAINIATDSRDCYSLSKTLKEANVSGKTILISISYFQFSDGAIAPGYFNVESYADLPIKERLSLYAWQPKDILLIQSALFDRAIHGAMNDLNFGAIDCKINEGIDKQSCKEFAVDAKWFEKHKWYHSPDTNGFRRKLLLAGLDNLSTLDNCEIIVYNGPVSQSFADFSDKNGVSELERAFDDFLSKECSKRKFQFHSFFNDMSLRSNSLYYDPQHLCSPGAASFTSKLIQLFK